MEALQTVLDYIKGILALLKDFFAELFPAKEEEGADDVTE